MLRRLMTIGMSMLLSASGIAQTPGGGEARGTVNALRDRLARVALARERDERFDIRDLEPALISVTPIVGVSRRTVLDSLGAPSVDCRRTLGNPGASSAARIAPCRAETDLVYSFYVLPRSWVGGGTELLLEFGGGENCIRASWVRTQ